MNILSLFLGLLLGIILIESFRYYFGFQSFLKRQKKSWIGFDLDGTLALSSKGPFHSRVIGEPIPSMIKILKEHIDQGKEVKILTARVSTNGTLVSIYNAIIGQYYIKRWCRKNIGTNLDVTSIKDFHMQLLYDDLVVQVKKDVGV